MFRQQTAPNANALERWDLHQFAEVAAQRRVIEAATEAQVRIAREFRNLIDPDRAMRAWRNNATVERRSR